MNLLIDTNVISELRKGKRCHANVAQWQKTITQREYISVITLLELRRGIQQCRRNDPQFADKLELWYHHKVKPKFTGNVLVIDSEVAERCTLLVEERTWPYADALITATAACAWFSIGYTKCNGFY
jgi:predicted nucleic acid-binding protein